MSESMGNFPSCSFNHFFVHLFTDDKKHMDMKHVDHHDFEAYQLAAFRILGPKRSGHFLGAQLLNLQGDSHFYWEIATKDQPWRHLDPVHQWVPALRKTWSW